MCSAETTAPTSAVSKVEKDCVLLFLKSALTHLLIVQGSWTDANYVTEAKAPGLKVI